MKQVVCLVSCLKPQSALLSTWAQLVFLCVLIFTSLAFLLSKENLVSVKDFVSFEAPQIDNSASGVQRDHSKSFEYDNNTIHYVKYFPKKLFYDDF